MTMSKKEFRRRLLSHPNNKQFADQSEVDPTDWFFYNDGIAENAAKKAALAIVRDWTEPPVSIRGMINSVSIAIELLESWRDKGLKELAQELDGQEPQQLKLFEEVKFCLRR